MTVENSLNNMITIEKIYVNNEFGYMLYLKREATYGSKTLRVQRLSATTGVKATYMKYLS